MAQIAGLADLRGTGPPGDTGVFQASVSIIVYPFTFSGVTYYVAQRMGILGWTLVSQGTVASTILQAAITAAPTGAVIVVKGSFTATAKINLKTDITLDLTGAIINWDVADQLFGVDGSVAAGTNLNANALAGARLVTTLADPGLVADDYVLLSSTARSLNQPGFDGEINRVLSVTGVAPYTINLLYPIYVTYNTADTAKISEITPVKNVNIIGGLIQGTGLDNVSAIRFSYGISCLVRDTKFDKIALFAIELYNSSNCLVDHVEVNRSNQAGIGYGVVINAASSFNIVQNSRFLYCRHGVAHTGYGASDIGFSTYTTVNKCTFLGGTNHCLDAHEGYGNDLQVTDCILLPADGYDGIYYGGNKLVVSNCRAYNASCFVQERGTGVREVYVSNCYTYSCYYGVHLGTSTALTTVIVDGLTMKGGSCLLYIQAGAATTDIVVESSIIEGTGADASNMIDIKPDCRSIRFINNRIVDGGRAGMTISGASYGEIRGNNINGCSARNDGWTEVESGIYLDVCTNLIITDNYIANSSGHQEEGIYENGACDYNDISHNNVTGNGTHQIYPVGTHDKIHQNTGYNPIGNIATPYSVAAGFLTDVAGAQAFPTTATNYTVGQSPKLITIYGGTITSVSINGVATGQAGAASFAAYRLEPEQILNVVWTIQPSSVVYAC